MANAYTVEHANKAAIDLLMNEKFDSAYGLALNNMNEAAKVGSIALIGYCAFTLGRVIHERELRSKQPKMLSAINAYEHAVDCAEELNNQEQLGKIKVNLATAFLEATDGNRKENLENAIECHQKALGIFSKRIDPLDYAKIQYNMGIAYSELTFTFGGSFLDEAKKCFGDASIIFHDLSLYNDERKAIDALQQINMDNNIVARFFSFVTRMFR